MPWTSIVPSEADEQANVIKWWAAQCRLYGLPSFSLYHVANEGSGSAIRGRRLKEQGVRAGIPDLIFDVPRSNYHGLRIEMKSKRGRPRKNQLDVLSWMESQGYAVAVCHGSTDAIDVIKEYLRG